MPFEFAPLIGKLKNARHLVVLTGAGISAESGIPTFRGQDGLWKNFKAEELATPQAFNHDPRLVWEWYNRRREIISRCAPNPGHLVLASWEDHFESFTLITQNVDGLHRKAGNRNICHLHGDIWLVRCTSCGKEHLDEEVPLKAIPPHCECGGLLRPGVVWFGESLPQEEVNRAIAALESADIALVIGTSGIVYPAAGMPSIAKQSGAWVVEINIERTPISNTMDQVILGPAGEVLPAIDKEVFGK